MYATGAVCCHRKQRYQDSTPSFPSLLLTDRKGLEQQKQRTVTSSTPHHPQAIEAPKAHFSSWENPGKICISFSAGARSLLPRPQLSSKREGKGFSCLVRMCRSWSEATNSPRVIGSGWGSLQPLPVPLRPPTLLYQPPTAVLPSTVHPWSVEATDHLIRGD